MVLICDNGHAWPQPFASFEHADGYMGQYSLAMRAGWKECTFNNDRAFFGPCCSGKVTHAAP